MPVFYGDCDDADFVDDLAKKTRVIAASLTPYTLVSPNVVTSYLNNDAEHVR